MARLLVTVGMGTWPFDRLIEAVEPLCAYHDVFVQTGTSSMVPPCPHARFVPFDEMRQRLAEADIVITHAGATVRLVQRLGGVPIVVARQRRLGETSNDRQERYLRAEEAAGAEETGAEQAAEPGGRVHAVWDVTRLADAVAGHGPVAARMLETRALPEPVAADHLIAVLDAVAARLLDPGT